MEVSVVTLTEEDVLEAIAIDPDFIALPRFKCSLAKFVERYPDGTADSSVIARALCCSEEQVEQTFKKILLELKKTLR